MGNSLHGMAQRSLGEILQYDQTNRFPTLVELSIKRETRDLSVINNKISISDGVKK